MSFFRIRPDYDALARCAPITEKSATDRAMRVAVQQARRSKKGVLFAQQQAFDGAIAKLVRDIPVDA